MKNKNMKKHLEIDYIYSKINNLTVMLIFLFSFFSISSKSFSESRPVTTIESLPTRERAEMNIEVTKVVSEKMKGKMNSDEKTISLDFTEVEERVAKSRMRIREEDYEIFFVEDINSLPTYSTNGMRVNNNNKKGIGRYNYKIAENNGKKKIKIEYVETPETLYMVVIDKRSGAIVKVFNISEFELENYPLENRTIANGMSHSYDKIPCRIRDFGDASAIADICVNEITVEDRNSSASFPVIGVGAIEGVGNLAGSYDLSASSESINHRFKYSKGAVDGIILAPIYLSNPHRIGGTSLFLRFIGGENSGKARAYGNDANNNLVKSISANLNMEINLSLDIINNLRAAEGNEITISPEETGNQITLFKGRESGNKKYYYLINTPQAANLAQDYPDIIFEKITMQNNIILNFKDGYVADTPIIFNQDGTAGYEEDQLKVARSGEYANNFFMTGLSSEGEIEVLANSFEGSRLGSPYVVGDNGSTESKEFVIPGNNRNDAKFSLGYGENGVVTLNLKEWDEEQEYEHIFYIIHKEESGLIRRKNRVTIKIPARGIVGGNNNFLFSSNFSDLVIRDYVGETVNLINKRGEVTAEENSNETAGKFPVVAIGSNWSREIKSLETQVESVTSEYLYEGNIPISVYLKNPVRSGGATAIYKQYIDNLGTSNERAIAYGATHYGGSTEKIKADLMMELPNDILDRIRNILQKDFTLNSNDNNQLIYMIGNMPTGGQYQIPDGGVENAINTTKRNFPTIQVEKEVVINDITLEFSLGYEKGSEVSFASNGQSSETKVTTETKGSHPNYFMTGIPFKGTMDISGSGMDISEIQIDSNGATSNQTLELRSDDGKRATLNLKYETGGVVKMSLENRTGQGEFQFQIIHREESSLARRTYNITLKVPPLFEIKSQGVLDFGTIIKGFTGDTAQAEIIISGLTSSNLVIHPPVGRVNLEGNNENSVVEVGEFSLLESRTNGDEKIYILSGKVLKSSNAGSGEHEGIVNLTIGLTERTKVNKR